MGIRPDNKYVQRLVKEWNQHGKIIIAVDFDDTISPWGFKNPEDIVEMEDTIKLLKECVQTGVYLVAFTACNEDRYIHIHQYFGQYGLVLDGINQTPLDLPYGKNGKIYANIFLDDRAGLTEAKEILRTALYMQRSYIAGQKLNNSGSTEF